MVSSSAFAQGDKNTIPPKQPTPKTLETTKSLVSTQLMVGLRLNPAFLLGLIPSPLFAMEENPRQVESVWKEV